MRLSWFIHGVLEDDVPERLHPHSECHRPCIGEVSGGRCCGPVPGTGRRRRALTSHDRQELYYILGGPVYEGPDRSRREDLMPMWEGRCAKLFLVTV